MALTQPILYTKTAFDATRATVFEFNVISGTQVTANTLTIKDNATLQTVYSETQNTFRFQHTLPANKLSNGTYYQAYLTTKDAQGNVSVASNTIQFYCYSEPSFAFTNMPINNIIQNSSFNFEVTYNQKEGETLNAYIFNLYNINGVLLSTSNTQYIASASVPTKISYMFSGFEDNTEYIIECKGVTAQGTQISTGQLHFTVSYIQPTLYSTFFVSNNCKDGYITIRSNVVGIPGVAEPDPPKFINNEELDLTAPGSNVVWNEGYQFDNNWTVKLWGRNFTPNTEIYRFSNTDGDIIIFKYCEDNTNAWIEMRALHHDWTYGYTTQSQLIAIPKDTEKIFIWIRRINNIYELKIENLGEGVIV